MAQRFDFSEVKATRVTPVGGLVAPAAVTRVGVFVYRTPEGGEVRELRSAEEVFASESLASLRGAAVTEDHPAVPVTPENWAELTRGHVVESSVQAERESGHVAAELAINDAATIAKVQSRELVELSCGYSCDLDETPGTTESGERYDRAQRNIRYNHVALGPRGWGRAGSSVALRLDSSGAQLPPSNAAERSGSTRAMLKLPAIGLAKRELRVDGVAYSLKTPEGRAQARAALDALARSHSNALVNARVRKDAADPAAVEAAVGALESALTQLREVLASMTSEDAAEPEAMKADEDAMPDESKADESDPEEKGLTLDARVWHRARKLLSTVRHAEALKPGIKCDSKSPVEIMREALAHVHGAELRTDSLSAEALRGAFLATKPVAAVNALSELGAATGAGVGRTDAAEAADPREAYHAHLAAAWRR